MLDFLKILLLPLIRLLCVPILESLHVIDCVYLHVLNQPCIYKVKLAWLSLQNFQYNTCKLNLKVRQMDHLWLSLTEEHFLGLFGLLCVFGYSLNLLFFSVRTIIVHQRIQEFKEDTRKQLSELKENKLKKNKLLSDYKKKKHEYNHELNGENSRISNSRIWKQNSLKQYKYQWAPNFEIMVKRKTQKLN